MHTAPGITPVEPGHHVGSANHGDPDSLEWNHVQLDPAAVYEAILAVLRPQVSREALLDHHAVPDLASSVFMAVWSKRDGLQQPYRYARRAARNGLMRFLSQERRRLALQRDWADARMDSAGGMNPASALTSEGSSQDSRDGLGARQLAFVESLLALQDGRTRLIVHLRYRGGHSWMEIAERVGMSAPSARMRLRRFMAQTRRAWDARGEQARTDWA